MRSYNQSWNGAKGHGRGILADDNEKLANELCIKVDLLRELSKNIGEEAEETSTSPSQTSEVDSTRRGIPWLPLLFISLLLVFAFLKHTEDVLEVYNSPTQPFFFRNECVLDGHAQFYLLTNPATVEILVKPIEGDVDLYAVANDDLDYFREHIPIVEKWMSTSVSERVQGLIRLEPPLAWETLSPPEEVKWTSNASSATTYWSARAPFSLSSIGLGEETLLLPVAEVARPAFVVVFAPSSGRKRHHQYVVKVSSGSGAEPTTYESVRKAAERGSLSYERLTGIYSTLRAEREGGDILSPVVLKSNRTSPRLLQEATVQTGKSEEAEESNWATRFFFGLLQALVENLL